MKAPRVVLVLVVVLAGCGTGDLPSTNEACKSHGGVVDFKRKAISDEGLAICRDGFSHRAEEAR